VSTDLGSKDRTLQAISAGDYITVTVKDGNFRVFGGLPYPGFRHG
jgi:hypothetical protein